MNRVLCRLLRRLNKDDIMKCASTFDGFMNDTYNDALAVYNQLSDQDKQYVSPSGRYIDSPYLISRKIKYINNQPVGFCEAYKFNGTSNSKAFLIIAVLEEYRGYNIASELLNQVISDCINQNYNYFIYKCDITNKISKKLAIKNHFSLTNKTKNTLTFTLQVNSNLSRLDKINKYPYYYRNEYLYNYPVYLRPYGYLPYSGYVNYMNSQQNINQDNLSNNDEDQLNDINQSNISEFNSDESYINESNIDTGIGDASFDGDSGE